MTPNAWFLFWHFSSTGWVTLGLVFGLPTYLALITPAVYIGVLMIGSLWVASCEYHDGFLRRMEREANSGMMRQAMRGRPV